MSITIDPTVPANSENPQLGATRIRNLTAELLQILGATGLAPVTYSVVPFTVNATTGLISLAGNATSGTQPTTFQQFTNSGTGLSGWALFPGGFLVQWVTTNTIASGSTVSLLKSYSAVTYVGVGVTLGNLNAVQVTPLSASSFTASFNGGSNESCTVITVGV